MYAVEPSYETVVSELHKLVKGKSSVPKVAEAIDMNYYSLRDNLIGKSEIKLNTVHKVLAAIGVSWDELIEHARVTEASKPPKSRRG